MKCITEAQVKFSVKKYKVVTEDSNQSGLIRCLKALTREKTSSAGEEKSLNEVIKLKTLPDYITCFIT